MPLLLKDIHAHLKMAEPLSAAVGNMPITHISADSRNIQPNSVFLALRGHRAEGGQFVEDALEKGAVAIYSDEPLPNLSSKIPHFVAPNLRQQLADLARFFYEDPSRSLKISAVTGTNGKTSIAYLLSDAQHLLHAPSYYVGTLGWGTLTHLYPSANTTPDIITFNQICAHARKNSMTHLNCEASSHGLDQGRLDGIQLHTAIFTNLTQDHLDYHHNMEHYFQAKLKLFERPELKHTILNVDDPYAARIQPHVKANVTCITTSIHTHTADCYAVIEKRIPSGSQVRFHVCGENHALFLPLASDFQISNLLAVLATLITQGFSTSACLEILPRLQSVKGRMERWLLPSGGTAIIDYAHTPDALVQVLSALRTRYSRIVTVFGCGGEKDRTKRPLMAEAAEKFSDQVIVTSDNSRREPFTQIVEDMMPGFQHPTRVMIEMDREQAILKAITYSDPDTVIVLAGKGHETYLDIGGEKWHFDERDVLTQCGGTVYQDQRFPLTRAVGGFRKIGRTANFDRGVQRL